MEDLLQKVLAGEPRAVARACSLAESRAASAPALISALFRQTGKAFTLGITGAPGAGKSTLTDVLIRLLRERGARIGVIAVDPSSPFSGGAVLGDRIRMLNHHADPGVFIRSMATRGALGGLAAATLDLSLILDAAGFDWILIETVGVGQDEVDIARLANATLVVLAPGMGDDVQAIKAGILEIADVFALNKSDQPGAERLEREMRSALELAMPRNNWMPPLVRTVASTGEGVAVLLEHIGRFRASAPPRLAEEQWMAFLARLYAERAAARLDPKRLAQAARRVAGREADPYTIIEEWLQA